MGIPSDPQAHILVRGTNVRPLLRRSGTGEGGLQALRCMVVRCANPAKELSLFAKKLGGFLCEVK
jgi:hypothetical protein